MKIEFYRRIDDRNIISTGQINNKGIKEAEHMKQLGESADILFHQPVIISFEGSATQLRSFPYVIDEIEERLKFQEFTPTQPDTDLA